jgi:SAM-dependent methyltransferase
MHEGHCVIVGTRGQRLKIDWRPALSAGNLVRMGADWNQLTDWWLEEVSEDAAYHEQVLPLLLHLLDPEVGSVYLDAGCGDGRVMHAARSGGALVIGCDLNQQLLSHARRAGPVVACRLPDLDWIRSGSLDGAYTSLVIEHLEEVGPFFSGLARAVTPGGRLVVVVNHPFFTAPHSGPVVDPEDGEVFWRWGAYLDKGLVEERAGAQTVTFFHRPMAALLNAAAGAGWSLDEMVELGVSRASEDPLLARQDQIPRLLGCRWIRERPAPR